MPFQPESGEELSFEAAEILKGILEETRALREFDLGDYPPANVFEADR